MFRPRVALFLMHAPCTPPLISNRFNDIAWFSNIENLQKRLSLLLCQNFASSTVYSDGRGDSDDDDDDDYSRLKKLVSCRSAMITVKF